MSDILKKKNVKRNYSNKLTNEKISLLKNFNDYINNSINYII